MSGYYAWTCQVISIDNYACTLMLFVCLLNGTLFQVLLIAQVYLYWLTGLAGESVDAF